ncbi:alpha-tocopherol transfer protein-like isoform X2 [Ptychodera flava]|uniref:alpha-tocopherol transfer protein-like isoform X2 n=1 Tax=Ptychodera flava TaxID=63121 RepID=UPI003969F2A3
MSEKCKQLSPEMVEKAKRELGETPEKRRECLDQLRDMFNTRPDIKFRSDDAFLVRFLRCKKFDVERAFRMMVRYYEVRRDHRDIFDDCVPSSIEYILKKNMHYVSTGRDNEGRRVYIFKPEVVLCEKILEEEETQINGMVAILDLANVTMNHVTTYGPGNTRKMTDIMQNAMPLRVKAVHYVHQSKVVNALFTMMRPFLSEKLKKRVQFHGDEFDNLHQQVPSHLLPSEYGGAVPEFDNREWRKILMASEEEFIENNKYGFAKSSDSLGGSSEGQDPNTGLKGSFKKLEI